MLTKLEKHEDNISIEETSKIIAALLPLHRKYSKNNKKTVCQAIKEIIKELLYFYSDRRKPDFVSVEAEKIWNTPDNPHVKRYTLFELIKKNKRLKNLHLEHCNTLSELTNEILTKNKDEEIEQFLKKNLLTCWITREENNKLNRSSYKQNRCPIIDKNKKNRKEVSNWKKCYANCDIVIRKRK